MGIEKFSGSEHPAKKNKSEQQGEPQEFNRETRAAKSDTAREKKLAEVRESLVEPVKPVEDKPYPAAFYGEFEQEQQVDGKIVLSKTAKQDVEAKARSFRNGAKFMTSTITGTPIATEYDNRTNNFSTQTKILALEDGRKVFAVYAHAGSAIHRLLDTLMKWASGLKMRKVSRQEWKKAFEEKSNIPVIENDDPHTVLLPFHSNVNAYDLMANNHVIENFGENNWAKDAGVEEKVAFAESIMRELRRVHGQGKAWGEAILPNIIFTKDKMPIICDPEIRYDNDVPIAEAKARDLKDILISVCGALNRADKVTDFAPIIKRLLSVYGDEDIIAELKKVASAKRGWLQNLTFGYEQVRSGTTSKQQYDEVLAIIQAI